MLSATFRAKAVAELGLGMFGDVTLQNAPLAVLIPDLLAKAANGENPLHLFHLTQGFLQIPDQSLPFRFGNLKLADVPGNAQKADKRALFIKQRLYQRFRPYGRAVFKDSGVSASSRDCFNTSCGVYPRRFFMEGLTYVNSPFAFMVHTTSTEFFSQKAEFSVW